MHEPRHDVCSCCISAEPQYFKVACVHVVDCSAIRQCDGEWVQVNLDVDCMGTVDMARGAGVAQGTVGV